MDADKPQIYDSIPGVARMVLAYAAGVDEDRIENHTTLLELGIDSVTALASSIVLETEIGFRLSPEQVILLFESSTVSEFITRLEHLSTELGECPSHQAGPKPA